MYTIRPADQAAPPVTGEPPFGIYEEAARLRRPLYIGATRHFPRMLIVVLMCSLYSYRYLMY